MTTSIEVKTGTTAVGIRAVSELTGLSLDTLRWYEREGLLPLVGRSRDGRRCYSMASVRFIRLVQALRRTGMPVADVRDFVQMRVGLDAHVPRMEILERHCAAIEQQIAQLHGDLEVVRAKIEHYRDLLARGLDCEDEIVDGAARAE